MKIAYIFFIITVFLYPVAQILEKKGMAQVGELGSFGEVFQLSTLIKVVTNPYIVAGVGLSIVSLVFWLATLSHWKISYLYPLGSIQQVVMLGLAIWLLGESVTMTHWLGVITIGIGITLLHI